MTVTNRAEAGRVERSPKAWTVWLCPAEGCDIATVVPHPHYACARRGHGQPLKAEVVRRDDLLRVDAVVEALLGKLEEIDRAAHTIVLNKEDDEARLAQIAAVTESVFPEKYPPPTTTTRAIDAYTAERGPGYEP